MNKAEIREALEGVLKRCDLFFNEDPMTPAQRVRTIEIKALEALAALDDDGWDTDMHTETLEAPKAEDLVKELTRLRAENERLNSILTESDGGCEWEQDFDGEYWNTTCGQQFELPLEPEKDDGQ